MIKKFAIATAFFAGLVGSAAEAQNSLGRYDLRVINASSATIVSIYVRNLVTDQVSGDILPGVIDSGGTGVVTMNDGRGTCNWRIQADLVDGRTARAEINVCDLRSWTVRN